MIHDMSQRWKCVVRQASSDRLTGVGITILPLLLVALTGYLLPWMVAQNSGMTLNAFDLAEWTRQHPTQSTWLVVPLLIRVQLPLMTMMFVLSARGRLRGWVILLIVILLSLSQLPPFEFARELRDPNYQQQFALAVVTLIGALIVSRSDSATRSSLALLILATIGVASALAGQSQAKILYQLSLQEGAAGAGLWITVVAYCLMVASALYDLRRRS